MIRCLPHSAFYLAVPTGACLLLNCLLRVHDPRLPARGLNRARRLQAEEIARELADKRAERAVLRLLARAQREVRPCMHRN